MGKFLPEASGVKIPMFLGYSEQVSNPQFDPLNPDIEWDDATRTLTRGRAQGTTEGVTHLYAKAQHQLHQCAQGAHVGCAEARAKEVAAIGAPLGRGEPEPLSYAYSDQEYHDVNTAYENDAHLPRLLAYQHDPKPRPIKPFDKVGFVSKSKWLKLIKDFNVNFGFKQVTFRTSVDRIYLERLVRPNPDIESLPPQPTYNKNFNWNSQYGFRYEITKSLKLDFNANNNAIIGETARPRGPQGTRASTSSGRTAC